MCHISHNKYKKDKNAGRNETGYSEETINKRRQKMLGKPSGMRGKHHTEETKLKLSE